MNLLNSIYLGIIEGLTEFLPVSSTAHLVLFNYFQNVDLDSAFVQTFEIVIQLGAILAVVVFFYKDFLDKVTLKKIAIGVAPTLVIAFLLKDFVEKFLSMPKLIAYNMLIGGVIIIIAEIVYRRRAFVKQKISYKNNFWLGVFQALSLMPGVSRSGAVIVSGLFMGLKREELVKYSFLLAVPVMMAATGYTLLKHRDIVMSSVSGDHSQLVFLAVGFVVSFLVALLAVKYFLPIVRKYSFLPFGIYRILFGALLLFFVF